MHPKDSFLTKRRSIQRVRTQCGSRCNLTALLVKRELVHLCFILLSSLWSIKTAFVLKNSTTSESVKSVEVFTTSYASRRLMPLQLTMVVISAARNWRMIAFLQSSARCQPQWTLKDSKVMVTLARGNFVAKQPPDYAGRLRPSRRERRWPSASLQTMAMAPLKVHTNLAGAIEA